MKGKQRKFRIGLAERRVKKWDRRYELGELWPPSRQLVLDGSRWSRTKK